jgi:DNA-binding MarR family transcriptional regulator
MDIDEQVLLYLRRIIRAIDLRSKELMQVSGLTVPQIVVLQATARLEPVTVGGIAEAGNLSQGTATSILNRLQARGLVARTRSAEDRRRVLVKLTALGRETLAAAPGLLQDHFVEAFRRLRPWEQSLILASFQRVAEMMDADEIDVGPLLNTEDLAEEPRPDSPIKPTQH